jgi:cytochrome P450 PksS
LPLSVICELLGLPLPDRAKFTEWASGFTRFTGALGFLGMMPKIFSMRRYIEGHLETVRRQGGQGLIAEIVRVEKDGGQISREEIVSMVFLLLFAGHETTTHLISGSAFELLKNPALRDWLREDDSRLDLAVEEFLRFITPVQFTKPRYVRRDVDLGGITVKKGDKVMPMLSAANVDPQANASPGRLDLQRRPNRHIAFGTGIHFCLGHQLARIEGRCALKSLFRRWPQLALAVDHPRSNGASGPGCGRSIGGRLWLTRQAREPGSPTHGSGDLVPQPLELRHRSLPPRHDCCVVATVPEHLTVFRGPPCMRRFLATPLYEMIFVG